jgi:transcriptional regulator with XRE-family HTH domain
VAIDICVRLGRKMRVLRSQRGWTQQHLADTTGIGWVHVSELENGKREAGLRTLEKLASAFEISVSDLLKSTDYTRQNHTLNQRDNCSKEYRGTSSTRLPANYEVTGRYVTCLSEAIAAIGIYTYENKKVIVYLLRIQCLRKSCPTRIFLLIFGQKILKIRTS